MKFSLPALLLALVLLAMAPGSQASTIQLPQTGQGTCINVAGAIPCAGTGQDGAIRAGKPWPNPRFADNADGTVTDNLTGLVWLKNANCLDSSGGINKGNQVTSQLGVLTWNAALTWSNNVESGICGLSDGSVAGQWRLPNQTELQSLLNGQSPSASWPFTGVSGGVYWSSTDGWIGYYYFRLQDWTENFDYVWPVRDGLNGTVQLPRTGENSCTTGTTAIDCAGTGQDGDTAKGAGWPVPRFTANANGTVTDRLTGLIWLQNGNCKRNTNVWPFIQGTMTWPDALAYSNAIGTGACGLSDGSLPGDWRMPNINELQSLVDLSLPGKTTPVIPESGTYFSNIWSSNIVGQSANYWSSTTDLSDSAYIMNVATGTLDRSYIGSNMSWFLWPVRGGQFGDAVMSVSPAARDFGTIAIPGTDTQAVSISNGGSASRMHVNEISLSGPDASNFVLNMGDGTGGMCGGIPIIPPGGSCTIAVSFTPGTVGAKSAILRISGSDAATPNKDVALSGTAVVNGVCGTSNGGSLDTPTAINMCTSGTPSALTGTGPWNWDCNGAGGGTNTSCSANIKSYSVAFTPGANGTLTGTTTQTVNYGSSTAAVTANANQNYHFSKWTGSLTSTSNPLTIGSVLSTMYLSANFAIDAFAVNFVSSGNGALSGNLSQTVDYDTASAIVTAVPNPGYHLVNWTEGSTVVGTGTTLSIPNVTAPHSYTANFAINTFAVNFAPGANGTLTGTSSQTINQGGSTTTVTAVPATGYHFVNWTEGTAVVGTGLALTVSNVTAAHSYTANFSIDTNAVTFASGGNGTLSGSASQAVALGGNATTVTAVPATGYHFVNWTEGGTQVGTSAALDITNVSTPHSYTANFAANTFTETFTSGANGSITGTASQTVGYLGSTSAVTAVPAVGYHFVKWTEGATLVGNSATLVVTSVKADHNYSATFAVNTYTVSYLSGGNGTVVGSASQTVVNGADAATVSAIPAAGYHFVNWTEGTTEAGSSTDLSITNVTASHIYKANFAINSYAVTYASGGNGTLTGSVTQTINHAGTATKVTAVPDLNYHFVNWTEGSTVAGTGAALTVTNVTAVHSYTANFATNTSTVTFSSGANGTITGSASQLVTYGADAATVTAVAGTGAQFLNWTEGATVVGTSAALTVTNVTSARSFTANFTIPTVNAVCGTSNGAIVSVAPGSNLCTSGTATVPTGSGPWTWQCISANGGTAAQCSAIPQSFSVAPSAATGCSITPSTPVTVKAMTSTKFTVATGAGYGALVTGCGGTLSGSTYTTGAITADCTVVVSSVSRDANGTGSSEPTIVDALKALSFYSDKVQLTPVEKIRYDVAPLSATGVPVGNGTVDIADVIMIMRRAVGIGSW